MPKPTNVTELRDQLLDAYDKLSRDPRAVNQVGELANTAGKILGTLKMEMEYAQLRGEKPEIPFMDTGVRKLNPSRKVPELAGVGD